MVAIGIPGEDLRDGKAAVKCATKACELTNWKNANCINTLAAAYAEIGRFEDAVATPQKAIDLALEDDLADYQSRIELYKCKNRIESSPTDR